MQRKVILMITLTSILSAASIEFPISTAPGEQAYPDVCWDGSAFWVVWQDEELETIQGVRISENGELLIEEVELLESDSYPGSLAQPVVAASPDRIAVEARVMLGHNSFGSELWGLLHNEYTFEGVPTRTSPFLYPWNYDIEYGCGTTPCLFFGSNHFFSIHHASKETPVDDHGFCIAWGFDLVEESAYDVWYSSDVQTEYLPPVACWNGQRYLVIYEIGGNHHGLFIEDSLFDQGVGAHFTVGRSQFGPNKGVITKYQALASGGSGFLWMSEYWSHSTASRYQMAFDILDSTAMLVKDTPTVVDLSQGVSCYYPDAVFEKDNFVAVWENRFDDNTVHLYSIKVDTFGAILDSGYLTFDNPVEQHPSLAFNGDKYCLAWVDNRDGEFNIYGMIFDTLELKEGIEEQNPPVATLSSIIAQPGIFSTTTMLCLANPNMNEDVTLKIYDNTGSLVRRLVLPRGERAVVWNGKDEMGRALCAGVYFVMPDGTKARTTRVIKIH